MVNLIHVRGYLSQGERGVRNVSQLVKVIYHRDII